ncbi:hypothetical protein PG993_013325 [Apiospora rasikravindrae]|uniref:Uncharacterized protein n=1 Tax=Apiospora rasikravindrae TaxID=990691 RepID=A0ABR1RXH7_9PEZI
MSDFDRKRKREDSVSGSSVIVIKPEPAFVDLDDSVQGNNNDLRNIAEAPVGNNGNIADQRLAVADLRPNVADPNPAVADRRPDNNASAVDLDAFTVMADRNHELIQGLMRVPEDLREEMAIKTSAIKNDVTTSMVAFTKQMDEKLDQTKVELKDKVDGYNPRLNRLERRANTFDTTVKELDKKIDKKIKSAQSGANKDHGINIKAEVKEEVNECLRGFGAYLTDYFANSNVPAPARRGNGNEHGHTNRNEFGRPDGNEFERAGGNGFERSNRAEEGHANRAEHGNGSGGGGGGVNANARDLRPRRPFTSVPALAAGAADPAANPAALALPALPVAGAGGPSGPSPAAPLVPANFTPEAVPLLSRDQFVPYQVLTNKGYHTLLQRIKFNDVNHLVQLIKLDNVKIARKCIMFTDSKFPLYRIDYVLHAGYGVRQMGYGAGIARHGGHDKANLLRNVDLSQLRLMKMKIDSRVMLQEDLIRYTEWERRWKPPAYVYDLGELHLRKLSSRGTMPITGLLTPFNLLLEVSSTNRRVWIVMAPQYEISRKVKDSVRDSNCPFNGLEFSRLALLAHNVADLEFGRSDFLDTSAGFEAAHRVVLESLCPGMPSVDFNKNISLKQLCNDLA